MKIQMPLYVNPQVQDDVDLLRNELAEELGVSSISRGDYITRLVKRDKQLSEDKRSANTSREWD